MVIDHRSSLGHLDVGVSLVQLSATDILVSLPPSIAGNLQPLFSVDVAFISSPVCRNFFSFLPLTVNDIIPFDSALTGAAGAEKRTS